MTGRGRPARVLFVSFLLRFAYLFIGKVQLLILDILTILYKVNSKTKKKKKGFKERGLRVRIQKVQYIVGQGFHLEVFFFLVAHS